jgi:hypothetical protein
MNIFVKSRRNRSSAVLVLLAWLFSIAVSSAYGCTLLDAGHHQAHQYSHTVDHDRQAADVGNDDVGGDADVCKVACDLQASSVVKSASGNAPDLQFVALYTSAYVLALAPLALHTPDKPHSTELFYACSQSLRSTRLTL